MDNSLRIEQSQQYEGDDWWQWSVWIEGPDANLDEIESVEWTLHPTFSDPVRKTTDRSSKFILSTGGWGTFPIKAHVSMKSGDKIRLRHNSELYYPDSGKAPA